MVSQWAMIGQWIARRSIDNRARRGLAGNHQYKSALFRGGEGAVGAVENVMDGDATPLAVMRRIAFGTGR